MLYGIERTANDRIRIGPKEFRLFVNDPPLRDGTVLGVEAAGRPYSGYQEVFEVEYLKRIAAHQLLPGLAISVYQPRLATKEIGALEFLNAYGAPCLTLSISYDYADWKHSSNLINFGSALAADLLKKLPDCVSATSKPEDVNVVISLKFDVPPIADLFEYLQDVDLKILQIIGERIDSASHDTKKHLLSLKPDEHGYKWWLRYIVIPVLSSAALIALLKLIF